MAMIADIFAMFSDLCGGTRMAAACDIPTYIMGTPAMEDWTLNILAPLIGATFIQTIHGKYPDGAPDLRFASDKPTRKGSLVIVHNGQDTDAIWRVNVFGDEIDVVPGKRTALILFMAVATQDRPEKNRICTSRAWAQNVKGDKIILVDAHAPHTVEYFKISTPRVVVELSMLPTMRCSMDADAVIVFPDAGASKKYKDMFPDHVHVTCEKIRSGDERHVQVCDVAYARKVVLNKHVWIVDDMIQSGSTLTACLCALQRLNVRSVNVAAVHAVLPFMSMSNDAHHAIQACGNNAFFQAAVAGLFRQVMVTDTIPGRGLQLQHLLSCTGSQCTVTVVSVADLIAANI